VRLALSLPSIVRVTHILGHHGGRLLPLAVISPAFSSCGDKETVTPLPFTPSATSIPTVTPTPEPSLPLPSTKTPGAVRP
jgi:hypothetical protein